MNPSISGVVAEGRNPYSPDNHSPDKSLGSWVQSANFSGKSLPEGEGERRSNFRVTLKKAQYIRTQLFPFKNTNENKPVMIFVLHARRDADRFCIESLSHYV